MMVLKSEEKVIHSYQKDLTVFKNYTLNALDREKKHAYIFGKLDSVIKNNALIIWIWKNSGKCSWKMNK